MSSDIGTNGSENVGNSTSIPQKSIDDIEDAMVMGEILNLLGVNYDRKIMFLDKMKKKAKDAIKEQSSGSGGYSKGTTGFTVIAKAKDNDVLKRGKLKKLYSEVATCLQKMGEEISIIDAHYPGGGVMESLRKHIDLLGKVHYNLLFAGESSAGKSSLLNLILGEELLPHHALNTTSTICELKFGKDRKLVVHYKYDADQKHKDEPTEHILKTKEECGKSYQEQIAPFVCCKQREKGSNYEKVEIFWPHELLQKGIVIIDTPGLGESGEMDEVLMNYLPNAFAFIYVMDVSRAGGVQKDIKVKLMEIFQKLQSSDDGKATLSRLAESSLFVCNKWDLIDNAEKKDVKKYVSNKLNNCWQNVNLYNQIVCISTTQAIKLQQYGGVTTEFNHLLESIERMILKTMNTRLYNHWKWLDSVLYHINKTAVSFNQDIISTNQGNREKINSIENRLEKISGQEQDVRVEITNRLSDQTKFLKSKLSEYISSVEFLGAFCNWNDCATPPVERSWEITKHNIKKAVQYRFEELLSQWERKNEVYSQIHRELVDQFLTRLNVIKEEFESVENALCPVETMPQIESHGIGITRTVKVLVGATIPFWVPVGVAGFILGMPVLGAMVVKNKVHETRKIELYRERPQAYLEQRCKKFLETFTEDQMLEYAKAKMNTTETLLSKYTSALPNLIEAKRRLVAQLRNETRNHNELVIHYTPIIQESAFLRGNVLPSIGVELCPETVNECDLDWKTEQKSCLGEGEFSFVYIGQLKNVEIDDESLPRNVVVKKFKELFDDLNSLFYLYEETTIRYLKHDNVVKFFGAARVKVSHASNEYTFIFVMELCQENLRSFISKDRSNVPVISSETKKAIQTFLKWAKEISDGLNYIHEKNLVHRHLKLENILVNEEGTAKISDIGIVGKYLETEKSITYLAPEVLENLANRTKESDIYSYGIALWELWYGIPAYTELMPIDLIQFREKIAGGHRPEIDEMTINIPTILNVIRKCWATKPEERHSAKECYEIFLKTMEMRVSKPSEKE